MANRWGKNGNSERPYFLGFQNPAGGDCSHEIQRCLLLGRKAMTNLDSMLTSRDITLMTKVCLVKAMVFPVQFSSVTQSCLTLCDFTNCSTPGLPVHHQVPHLPKFMSIELVMPSNHLILCRTLLFLPSIFPSLFHWVSSSHQVTKVLEFQL